MVTRAKEGKLTLYLDGQHITAERFLRAVEAFTALVKDVAESMTGSGRAVDWVVSVREGSINLDYQASPRVPTANSIAIADTVYEGLKLVQGGRKRPAHFSDSALQNARDLARLATGKAVRVVQVRRGRHRVSVDDRAAVNVDFIMGGTDTELGTIEGTLQMISARGSLHVGVWDAIRDRQVRCYISPELLEKVKNHFGDRVAVHGLIHQRANGEPVSIEVENVEPFPKASSLPTIDDVYGILTRA